MIVLRLVIGRMDKGLACVERLGTAAGLECHRSAAGKALKEVCSSQYRSAIKQ